MTTMTNEQRSNNLRELRTKALDSCVIHGHDMSTFVEADSRGRIYRAECRKCSAYVDLNISPLPNEIDIGGTAVAVNCE